MTAQNDTDLIQRVIKISNARSSLFLYKFGRMLIRTLGFWYFKIKVKNPEALEQKGRFIIAPVHRSNLDGPLINACFSRRIRSFAKISMFKSRLSARISAIIGAIPVDREKGDRKALKLAEEILENEEALLLFPEGARASGKIIENLYAGCAFLAIKTQAPVIPVAIAGSEAAMPSGKKIPRRTPIYIEIGDKLDPPQKNSRSVREEFTRQLQVEIQRLMDKAASRISQSAA